MSSDFLAVILTDTNIAVVYNLQNLFIERKATRIVGPGYEDLKFEFVERGDDYVRQQRGWVEDMKKRKAWL